MCRSSNCGLSVESKIYSQPSTRANRSSRVVGDSTQLLLSPIKQAIVLVVVVIVVVVVVVVVVM